MEGISEASPGSLQGLNEDVGWWEQHGPSPGFHTGIQGGFGCPSAEVAEEGRTLSSCCSHLHRDR